MRARNPCPTSVIIIIIAHSDMQQQHHVDCRVYTVTAWHVAAYVGLEDFCHVTHHQHESSLIVTVFSLLSRRESSDSRDKRISYSGLINSSCLCRKIFNLIHSIVFDFIRIFSIFCTAIGQSVEVVSICLHLQFDCFSKLLGFVNKCMKQGRGKERQRWWNWGHFEEYKKQTNMKLHK